MKNYLKIAALAFLFCTSIVGLTAEVKNYQIQPDELCSLPSVYPPPPPTLNNTLA